MVVIFPRHHSMDIETIIAGITVLTGIQPQQQRSGYDHYWDLSGMDCIGIVKWENDGHKLYASRHAEIEYGAALYEWHNDNAIKRAYYKALNGQK